MGLGYDIFRELSDGSPIWVTHAMTLEEAKQKLEELAGALAASYFIRDARSAQIVARRADHAGKQSAEARG